jgi:hypothetical protein
MENMKCIGNVVKSSISQICEKIERVEIDHELKTQIDLLKASLNVLEKHIDEYNDDVQFFETADEKTATKRISSYKSTTYKAYTSFKKPFR